jgi:hypothetical protein
MISTSADGCPGENLAEFDDLAFDFFFIGVFGDDGAERPLEHSLAGDEDVGGLHGGFELVANDESLVVDGIGAFEGGGDDAALEHIPDIEPAGLATIGLHAANGFVQHLTSPGDIERFIRGGGVVGRVLGFGERGCGAVHKAAGADEVIESSQEQGAEFTAVAIGPGGKIVLKDFSDDEFLEEIVGLLRLHTPAADEMRGECGAIKIEKSGEGFFVLGVGWVAGLGDQGPLRRLKASGLKLWGQVGHKRAGHPLRGHPGRFGG